MRCSDIGVQVSKEQFCDLLNGVRGGQFFHVRGYINEQGEVADHVLRFGIGYGNIKKRDINTLNAILNGTKSATIHVKHGVWLPDNITAESISSNHPNAVHVRIKTSRQIGGVSMPVEIETDILLDDPRIGNRKGQGRIQASLEYHLTTNHPAVIAAIGTPTTDGTLLQSLVNPKTPTVEYDKEAKSCYSLDKGDGSQTKWYIRDVLRVWKRVTQPCEYPFSASLPRNAVKEALSRDLLLTGKYRQFILTDGGFESITIEGQAVLCDGISEEFFFALPETVNAALQAEKAQAV